MSDYSNSFDVPAKQWAASGIATLAFDQRGFGAGPNPGLWAGSDVMRADFFDFVAAARARYPGLPVFALGESMGGAVLLSALTASDAPHLDGVILVAPAVWSRGDMPLSYRVALFVAAHLAPGLILSNSAASHVVTIVPSDNIAMLRALSRDPLFQKQTRARCALYGLVNLMDEARAAPRKAAAGHPAHPADDRQEGSGHSPIRHRGRDRPELGSRAGVRHSTMRAITCCCATWKVPK